jgi:RES domain-containing protein
MGQSPLMDYPNMQEIEEMALKAIPLYSSFHGELSRWVRIPYGTKSRSLDGRGSSSTGGRCNPTGVAAIYAALDPETAFAEWLEVYRQRNLRKTPIVFLQIVCQLQAVLDLSDAPKVGKIGLDPTADPLWGEINRKTKAETRFQAFARWCKSNTGLEAIIFSSHRGAGKNIVIYPDLKPLSVMSIVNDHDLFP